MVVLKLSLLQSCLLKDFLRQLLIDKLEKRKVDDRRKVNQVKDEGGWKSSPIMGK